MHYVHGVGYQNVHNIIKTKLHVLYGAVTPPIILVNIFSNMYDISIF